MAIHVRENASSIVLKFTVCCTFISLWSWMFFAGKSNMKSRVVNHALCPSIT
jgi:hypothetical protein